MNDKIHLYATRLAKLAELNALKIIVMHTFMMLDRAMRLVYEDEYFKAKRAENMESLRVRYGLCIDCGEPAAHNPDEKEWACADCKADRATAEAEIEEDLTEAEEESFEADGEED
jgi:ribosomal protein L37AE/L43A